MSPLRPRVAAAILGFLVVSALAILLAPLAMPESYSWVKHTTSESAAQGVSGAWLARLAFVSFGASVLALASISRQQWGIAGMACHSAFGVLMIAAAVFSARSWIPEASFDPTEDTLHSVAASAMGAAFAAGVVATLVARRSTGIGLLGPLAIVASIVLPLGMTIWEDYSGALQRLMFGIAYLWYGREALRLAGPIRHLLDATSGKFHGRVR